MPYKLVYFPVRGRAQAFKYLCTDNDIEFTVETIPMDMKVWGEMKPKTMFGQLPIVYDGDFELAQSNAILRHLARKHGLYGSNEKEMTMIDMINDQQEDTRMSYIKLIYQEYDTGKADYINSLPDKLTVFEKTLAKNNGGSGFFVGSKISFLDYNMFDLLDNLQVLCPSCLDKFPLLKGFHTRMASREKLAKLRSTDEFKKMPINGNGKQ